MTKDLRSVHETETGALGTKPRLSLGKIGIVSRDYRTRFGNGYRDFSHSLPQVLRMLDNMKCDTVLFSLFSIVPRKYYSCRRAFGSLKNIRTVCVEEFRDGSEREAVRYVIYHRTSSGWDEYEVQQKFGTTKDLLKKEPKKIIQSMVPERNLGKVCVLLCGETNGVTYSTKDKRVHDKYGLYMAIDERVNVVLNPIHDRMTRFEMKLKRQFLSTNGRFVISVWNKGKKHKDGKTRDGKGPPWTVFHNGEELQVERIDNNYGVEIGVLSIGKGMR